MLPLLSRKRAVEMSQVARLIRFSAVCFEDAEYHWYAMRRKAMLALVGLRKNRIDFTYSTTYVRRLRRGNRLRRTFFARSKRNS